MSFGEDAAPRTRPTFQQPYGSELGSIAVGHLRHLARQPRPTCSAEAADARQYCSHVLSSAGYRVVERPFEYSALVGLYGTPVAGAASLLLVVAAAVLSLGGHHGAALAVLTAGFSGVALGGRWLASRGVLALPLLRRRGVNIEAVRGDGDPELWLVAHSDSKSQPVPLLVRAAGIVLLGLATVAAFALAIAGLLGAHSVRAWPLVIIAAILGAIVVLGSIVGRGSHGAVDNASGVVTVLCVAEALRRDPEIPVGILITDAEELGLAGARAWCAETSYPAVPVLNCDGVDDVGQLTVMWTRPRARRLEDAFRYAASRSQRTLRFTRLIPGVLVDAVAFSDSGWEAVTLSRGSLATLTRIHTRADDLQHLTGRGIVDATLLLWGAVSHLTGL